MATTLDDRHSAKSRDGTTPPLENGDRLTREEFLQRYKATPHIKKAERIEGVVYMQAAVRFRQHGQPHSRTITWLGHYEAQTPGVEGGDNTTLQLDIDNDPQPDAFLRIAPECGGQSATTEDGYVEGAPELIAEVASSSASYDLHDKLNAYRRNGVQEYLVWKVQEEEITWFRLREGRYEALPLDEAGRYKSEIFPGLWLEPARMLAGDLAGVLKVLDEGLATEEHTAFMEKLKAATNG